MDKFELIELANEFVFPVCSPEGKFIGHAFIADNRVRSAWHVVKEPWTMPDTVPKEVRNITFMKEGDDLAVSRESVPTAGFKIASGCRREQYLLVYTLNPHRRSPDDYRWLRNPPPWLNNLKPTLLNVRVRDINEEDMKHSEDIQVRTCPWSVPTIPGDSGSPILNEKAQCVGVHRARVPKEETYLFEPFVKGVFRYSPDI